MLIHYDKEEFDKLIEKKVLVDFFATWCGPCNMLSPVLEQVSKEIDIDIVKVDVDKNNELAKKYGIMSIPCLILFDNSKEIKRSLGYMSKDKVIEFIK